MNVTVIYGITRKEITYSCVQLLLNNLKDNININITEYFLPKDLLSFNPKGFSNFIYSKKMHSYTNTDYFDSIIKSLDGSDLIILASSVFTCDISTEMKSFLDYISHHYSQKITNYSMNDKIGLAMCTAAGAGLFHATRNLKKTLNSWGINNTFKFYESFYEMSIEYLTSKTRRQIDKKILKLSSKVLNLYSNLHPIEPPTLSKITCSKQNVLFKKYKDNIIDFNSIKNQAYIHDRHIL